MSNSTEQLDTITKETLMLVSHLIELDNFGTVAAWEVEGSQLGARSGGGRQLTD